MSYLRDPDRKTRGVGAIASRDAVRRPRRFAPPVRRRALGDMPSGACYFVQNGSYYVRRPGGQIEKVSPQEALQYPPCVTSGGQVTTTPTPLRRIRTVSMATAALPPGVRPDASIVVRPQMPGSSSTPATTATDPSSGGGISRPGGKPKPPPLITPPALPPKPPPSSTTVPPKGSSVATTSTAPGMTTAPSVSTQWLPPLPPPPPPPPAPDESLETTVVVAPPAAPGIASGKNLVMVGAGIGLLYLLLRK